MIQGVEVKRVIITFILFVLIIPYSFCDDVLPGTSIGFKIFKVAEIQSDWKLDVFFAKYNDEQDAGQRADLVVANTTMHKYSATDMDFNLDLSTPQLGLCIWTKNIYDFGIKLSFSMMVNEDKSSYAGYDARIFRPVYYNTNFTGKASLMDYSQTLSNFTELATVYVNSRSGVSCSVDFNDRSYPGKTISSGPTFKGGDPQYDNGREGWFYPISFEFRNYDYTTGDYTATIVVEVISNT